MSDQKLPDQRGTSHLERVADGFRVRLRFGEGQQARFTIKVPSEKEAERRAETLRQLAAALVSASRRAEESRIILGELCNTTASKDFEALLTAVRASVAKPARRAASKAPTFEELAADWTSGRLAEKHPDHVKAKRSVRDDEQRLAVLNRTIGKIPLSLFKLEDAERAMAELPAGLSATTRRQYAQALAKVLKLAVYPCRLIEQTPLPAGFLPKISQARAKNYLYPSEDAALMGKRAIPIGRRMLWGFLAREGMRLGEALALRWSDLDLERGTLRLDENKTDDPRAWVLGPDVVRALKAFKPSGASPGATVFPPLEVANAAGLFRGDLVLAGIKREELFSRSGARMPIRVHDLRGSFVTLALATGRTETWVSDRTGHKSSVMVNRYRRAARTAGELGLTWFGPLDTLLPECRGESQGESDALKDGTENVSSGSESSLKEVCRRKGSNLHEGLPRRILNPLRLPFRHFGLLSKGATGL